MGLAASQARILLLTAKNDSLELQAQLISNERLILAQEQEEVANDYSDATSNQIYTCRVLDNTGTDGKEYKNKTMTLDSLAQSLFDLSSSSATSEADVTANKGKTKESFGEAEFNKYDLNKDGKIDDTDVSQAKSNSSSTVTEADVTANKGKTKEDFGEAEFNKYDLNKDGKIDDSDVEKAKSNSTKGIVYVKIGNDYYGAQANYDFTNNKFNMTYYKNGVELKGDDSKSIISALNSEGAYSLLQTSGRNGLLELYVDAPEADDDDTNTDTKIGNGNYVRKSLESLSSVTSRYYTEDDAAAQAEYNAAMARVNAMDKRLENKLNQVETQKKAVETELDSAKQIVKSNIERTFKYFS